MLEIARMTVRLRDLRTETNLPDHHPLHPAINRLLVSGANHGAELAKVLEDADECTVVYYGCGSCADGGARVEYYCNSSGGSQPDYVLCEPC